MAFARLGDIERAWDLMRMINPVRHGSDAESCKRYKVEPYVVTADVYAVEPHVGRGGWSWYTGSSGWMYRLLLESLLGLTRQADKLLLAPRLPASWPGFTLHYRHGSSTYILRVTRGEASASPTEIALVDDGTTYEIDIKA